MGYYERHIFFCVNSRDDPQRACCAAAGAQRLHAHAKARIKALGLSGVGRIRVNQSGCLDRCEEGPTVVVYPEGIWYRCFDEQDVDEIIDSHLVRGEPVARLRLP